MTLFSCILGSGSSLPVPAEGDESKAGGGSRGLGWDDSSVISGETEEKMGLTPEPKSLLCFWLNSIHDKS